MAEINKPLFLNKTWAQNGDKVEPTDLKKEIGWVPEIPTCEAFNWIDNRQDTAIAHISQYGIPIWDSTTEYIINKSFSMSSLGDVYKAKLTNSNIDPDGDTTATYWKIWDKVNTLTPALGSNYTQSANPLTVSVKGGQVVLNGNFTMNATGSSTVFTLANIYRPSSTKYITAMAVNGSTVSPFLLTISTAGVVSISNITQAVSDSYYISGAFPL